ncbi:hypothetical protein NSA24_00815 [Clostridioides mangenotii]|uniref:hypothetical protein n=1 Tax=Metaclostridioides mangenotii TaxID=1540 RepID=UPI001C10F5E1|nr:hypothetical protein [Clostridioides mangenotii]MBU5308397.1 hypothetical protein [Clostridioides mangenotii]MCR1953368.1 hypothetical protein [Clostridioides mangenotii]
MGSIMLNKNKIMDFNDNDKEYLIDYCSTMGVKYIVDNEDIVLFPRLFEKTLILKDITNNKEERKLVESIKNILINEGATVISDESFIDKASLEYIDVQLSIVISFEDSYKDLTIYKSSYNKETSTLVAKQLLKQIILSKKFITYKIANMWNKLKKIKYWTYLFGNSTSTLILEISRSALCEDFSSDFEDILVKSIIEELGDKPSYEKVEEFICKSCEKVEELICKLKSYKNQLNELNQSYTNNVKFENIENTEDKESISNDEEKKSLSEDEEKDYNDNKKLEEKTDKEKDKAKSKKIYLPNIPIDNINQADLNHQIQYPIMYPGEGPVHEFQRPKLENKKSEVQADTIKKIRDEDEEEK